MVPGTHGPASGFVVGFIVLVMVIVPVCATVLAGVVVNAGVSGAMLIVAIVSWPVSETNSAAPLPTGFTSRVAFLAACDVLMGLKTTLTTQLSPGARVDVPGPTRQVLDWMVKLAMLHPVVTFVQEIPMDVLLNDSGATPVLMTWMS